MARAFDGGSQVFSNSAATPVTIVPFTMCCWFLPTDVSGAQVMLNIGRWGVQADVFLMYMSGSDLRAQTWRVAGNEASVGTVTAGIWQHGTVVFAAVDDRTVYLDGASNNDTGSTEPTAIDSINIGGQRWGGSHINWYEGSMAEVGVWDVALSVSEIAALEAGATPPLVRPGSLVFYDPLVRGPVGGTSQDIVGGITMSDTGSITVDNHPPVTHYPTSPAIITAPPAAPGGDPEGPLTRGKLIRGGILAGRLVA